MNSNTQIDYVSATEPVLKFLIDESECAIEDCKLLKQKYSNNHELVHMYSMKMLHYEFMICRLKRHLKTTRAPKRWCTEEKI